jgi:hypothetical protein
LYSTVQALLFRWRSFISEKGYLQKRKMKEHIATKSLQLNSATTMMEASEYFYSENPSEKLMKAGMTSVIMSELAFDTFKKFNAAASEHEAELSEDEEVLKADKVESASEYPLTEGIHRSVVELLKENLPNGEVPFTGAFCEDLKIKESASTRSLTVHAEWTFKHTRSDGRTTKPRSDIVFVRDHFETSTADEQTIERTPVALVEVRKSKLKGSADIDDMWFGKLGQGTKHNRYDE